MKIDELMLGDWVRVNDPNGPFCSRVYGLSLEPSDIYAKEPDLTFAYPYDEDCVDPIPLTPEILEKNGFEKLDFSHFQIGDRRLVLDADGRWDGPLSWHWVVTEMDTNAKGQPVVLDYYVATISYVHELQNALRICGIEKEVEL